VQQPWTSINYVETRQGVSNIRGQPLDGGNLVQLTDFKSGLIFSWVGLAMAGSLVREALRLPTLY
jgi:hypothetical protein